MEEPKKVASMGVDVVVPSNNHGCRQQDRAPVPFHVPQLVKKELAVDVEIMIDSSIFSRANSRLQGRSR